MKTNSLHPTVEIFVVNSIAPQINCFRTLMINEKEKWYDRLSLSRREQSEKLNHGTLRCRSVFVCQLKLCPRSVNDLHLHQRTQCTLTSARASSVVHSLERARSPVLWFTHFQFVCVVPSIRFHFLISSCCCRFVLFLLLYSIENPLRVQACAQAHSLNNCAVINLEIKRQFDFCRCKK